MLGRGATLPGGCRWGGASVDPTAISARYDCPGGEVLLELRHPREQGPAGVLAVTERFAIARRRGEPPPGLVDAVVSSVRAKEGAFRWTEPPGSSRSTPIEAAAIVAALLALGVVALFRRRARARVAEPVMMAAPR